MEKTPDQLEDGLDDLKQACEEIQAAVAREGRPLRMRWHTERVIDPKTGGMRLRPVREALH